MRQIINSSAYRDNVEVIGSYNYDYLLKYNIYCAVVCLLISAASMLMPDLSEERILYLAGAAFCLIMWVLSRTVLRGGPKSTLIELYISTGAIFLITILLGTVYTTDQNATAFVCLITLLPSLILDRPWRITLFSASMAAIFCAATLCLKPSRYSLLDCFNALTFFVIGNMMMRQSVRTRMVGIISVEHIKWNESRYRALLLETNDIVFEYDLNDKLFHINNNKNRFPDADVTYDNLVSGAFVFEEDRGRYSALLEHILTGRLSTLTDEIRLKMPNGGIEWFSVYATAVIDTQNSQKRIIGKFTNIDAQKRREDRLRVMSQTDLLTGLYNKYTTEQLITDIIEKKPDGCHALMVADMDDLKIINNTRGHACGDSALKAVADVLSASFRQSDIIGRIGGDEFMVFLSDCGSRAQAAKLTESMLARIERIPESEPFSVGLSVGVTMTVSFEQNSPAAGCPRNSRELSFKQLYREADTALYKMKRRGKSGYVFYAPELGLIDERPPDDPV